MYINVKSNNSATNFSNKFGNGEWIVLYYADWCGHCTAMKPEWNKFIKNINTNTNNKSQLNTASINSDYINDLTHKPIIEGYPTITMYNNGVEVAKFNDERKYDNIRNFAIANSSINQLTNKKRKIMNNIGVNNDINNDMHTEMNNIGVNNDMNNIGLNNNMNNDMHTEMNTEMNTDINNNKIILLKNNLNIPIPKKKITKKALPKKQKKHKAHTKAHTKARTKSHTKSNTKSHTKSNTKSIKKVFGKLIKSFSTIRNEASKDVKVLKSVKY